MKGAKIVLIALFCAFIATFGLAMVILPDAEFSENENRYLAKAPELSAKALFSGEFGEKFETYLADQFPLREPFVAIKSTAEQLSGKRENNGAFICGDTLLKRFDEPDMTRVDRNLGYLSDLRDKLDALGIPGYLTVIPSSTDIWSDKLPAGAPTADQGALVDYIAENSPLEYIDTRSALIEHADEYIFYRTDHHWTTRGAYYGYRAAAEAMGFQPIDIDGFEHTTVSDSFYGTTYSSSGVRSVPPDSIETWVTDDCYEVIRTDENGETATTLYDKSFLEKKDKYSMFLGGNCPLVVVKNTINPEGGVLVIVRDSYADSEIPFLAQHFSEIHLIDPRYYKIPAAQYASQVNADAVLISYGLSDFVTTSELLMIGK